MLMIRVELWPHGSEANKKEISRMRIYNDGHGTIDRGDYIGETFVGKTEQALEASYKAKEVSKKNVVYAWPRKLHVWNLVSQMLDNMGYGFNGPEGWA